MEAIKKEIKNIEGDILISIKAGRTVYNSVNIEIQASEKIKKDIC